MKWMLLLLLLCPPAIADGFDCTTPCAQCSGTGFDTPECVECTVLCHKSAQADRLCKDADDPVTRKNEIKTAILNLKNRLELVDNKCSSIPADEPHPDEVRAECARLKGKIRGEIDSLKKELNAKKPSPNSALCPELKAQLEKDKEAIRRLQKSLQTVAAELEKWGEEVADMQYKAFRLALKGVIDSASAVLSSRQKAVQKLQERFAARVESERGTGKAWTRQTNAVAEELQRAQARMPGIRLQTEIQSAGKWNERLERLEQIWAVVVADIKIVLSSVDKIDARLKEILDDPDVKKLLDRNTEEDMWACFLRILGEYPRAVKFNPAVNLTQFLIDAGYEATRYQAARANILNGSGVTEEMLNAQKALDIQLKKTLCRYQFNKCQEK